MTTYLTPALAPQLNLDLIITLNVKQVWTSEPPFEEDWTIFPHFPKNVLSQVLKLKCLLTNTEVKTHTSLSMLNR